MHAFKRRVLPYSKVTVLDTSQETPTLARYSSTCSQTSCPTCGCGVTSVGMMFIQSCMICLKLYEGNVDVLAR
jgi:hypothetical protein